MDPMDVGRYQINIARITGRDRPSPGSLGPSELMGMVVAWFSVICQYVTIKHMGLSENREHP